VSWQPHRASIVEDNTDDVISFACGVFAPSSSPNVPGIFFRSLKCVATELSTPLFVFVRVFLMVICLCSSLTKEKKGGEYWGCYIWFYVLA